MDLKNNNFVLYAWRTVLLDIVCVMQ